MIKKPGTSTTSINSSGGKVTVKRISDRIEADFNKHIQAELLSAQIYDAMAVWCKDRGYFGGAKRFEKYADEERTHADKMYDYILDRDCLPIVPEIPKPQTNYNDIFDVVTAAYKHELEVSDSYHVSADLAMSEKDHTAYVFLQWFIKEQIEEEAKFADLIYQYNILATGGITGTALMEFDEILGED